MSGLEPHQIEVTRYVIPTKVDKLVQDPNLGWWVHFQGSWESLFLGADKPDMNIGDEVIITIQRRTKDAKTIKPPIE